MAHYLPRFPVLVFVFLVVHVHVFSASRAGPLLPATYDGSMCSDPESPSRCGSVYIRYPFYLASATELATDNVTTYSCGYRDLKISCQGYGETERAIIQLGQYTYTVKDISYDTRTLLLADADALQGGGNNRCPIISHNVTFSYEWLRYTTYYDNLTFLSRCYLSEDVPPGFGEYRIDCPDFSSSSGVGAAYVFTSDEHHVIRDHDLTEHCHDIVVVPVLSYSLPRKSNRSMLRSAYGVVLRNGFELAWSGTAVGGCRRCEYSGGRCAYSQNKVFLGCLCPDEKVETQYCSNSSASRTPSRSSKSLTKLIPSIASHRLYIFEFCTK